MPLLTHLYPSLTLATECDPLKLYMLQDSGEPLALDVVYQATKTRIEHLLDQLPIAAPIEGRPDESWYWAAPILIDFHMHPEGSADWWNEVGLASQWRAGSEAVESTEADEESQWAAHLDYVRELIAGNIELGPQPDDLADLLTFVALGSPAITALRAFIPRGGWYGDQQGAAYPPRSRLGGMGISLPV
jgi:hypothetical protein